jgi:hypothetical protein
MHPDRYNVYKWLGESERQYRCFRPPNQNLRQNWLPEAKVNIYSKVENIKIWMGGLLPKMR